MSVLFTKVQIPKPGFEVDYNSSLFFLGSCFSDNTGSRMHNLKFNVCHNPFGVVFNPVSISNSIRLLLNKEIFTEKDLNFYNELWFSFSHNTQYSDVDKKICLDKINNSFIAARNFIQNADVLFLTLGSSWIYELKESGETVANCHKIPSGKFKRYFSSVENTTENLCNAIIELRKSNPSLKIVLTVSPIRHWKDGAIENQKSKAALILAIAKLQEQLKEIYYFPAYEIFMDELRDYRYYADDMLHPSNIGIEYIWEHFANTFLSGNAKSILNQVQSILKRLNHRPLHRNTTAYKKLISSLRADIYSFQEIYPNTDFKKELKTIDKSV